MAASSIFSKVKPPVKHFITVPLNFETPQTPKTARKSFKPSTSLRVLISFFNVSTIVNSFSKVARSASFVS